MSQRSRAAGESIGFLAVVAAIFVALNILGIYAFVRADLTESGQFTLSESSEALVRELPETLQITAYITEDLPFPHIDRNIRDLLVEYENAADGKIELTIVNPDSTEEEEDAEEAGVLKRDWPDIREGEGRVKQGYRGIVLSMYGQTETINVSQPSTAGLEYEITRGIMKLAGEKKKIGIVTGHGGPTLTKGMTALRENLPLYELTEVGATEELPEDLAAVLIFGPETPFTETELRYLNQYVMSGGSLGVFGGGFKLNMEGMLQAESVETNLNTLLGPWGVRIKDRPILDRAQYSRIPIDPRLPFRQPYIAVPAVAVEEALREHPVTYGLRYFELPWPSALDVDTEEEGVTVLAYSSDRVEIQGQETFGSWTPDENPIDLNPQRQGWPPPASRDEWGPFPMLVAIEGVVPSAFADSAASTPEDGDTASVQAPAQSQAEVRVLVSGSGTAALDIFGNIFPNTQTLALNAIDWLANETDLNEIRAKNVEPPQISIPTNITQQEEARDEATTEAQLALARGDEDAAQEAAAEAEQAEESRRDAEEEWRSEQAVYTWGNTLGIPLFLALIGVIRWRYRAAQKKNIQL